VAAFVLVRKDSYFDSVLLMRISRDLKAQKGVEDAVVAMGTPHNRELLAKSGYLDSTLESATANDLIIAVRAVGLTDAQLKERVDTLLSARPTPQTAAARPTSLKAAVAEVPAANLVLISLPGEHAAREARKALLFDKHVMLFSDNVPVEDEVALKRLARERGLLMMGPDCGTSIINGKPLAFANVVRRGPIGIVGAAGTGIQEISACIHRLGGGVSQAIGTGGRDLSDAVGGIMVLFGIESLAQDPATKVLVVVSKPPSPTVAEKVIAAVAAAKKPAVIQFVGDSRRKPPKGSKIVFADSLAGAAEAAVKLARVKPLRATRHASVQTLSPKLTQVLTKKLKRGATLRGLFCGGTTGAEALVLLTRAGQPIFSNLHKKGDLKVDGLAPVKGHALLDLGDDVFTAGRPHPMIEPVLRNERLKEELKDKSVGILLFDVVLGFGSHADPAGVLVEVLGPVLKKRKNLVAVASVTGTDEDPQNYTAQCQKLSQAGVAVLADNRRASELCAQLVKKVG